MVVKYFECEVKTQNQRRTEVKVVASVIGFDLKGQPEEGRGESFLNCGNDILCVPNVSLNGCMIPTPSHLEPPARVSRNSLEKKFGNLYSFLQQDVRVHKYLFILIV